MTPLVKAKLFSLDSSQYDIEFMFNPSQLDFTRGIKLNAPEGANTKEGQPKVSFAYPDPCVITLSKIVFDTYEERANVLDRHINQILKSVKFIEQQKRPPVYLLIWGKQDYLRCFVESLKYQLTMFLPDGTPVRAIANMTLKEVDESVVKGDVSTNTPSLPDRQSDNRDNRLNQQFNPRQPSEQDRFGNSKSNSNSFPRNEI